MELKKGNLSLILLVVTTMAWGQNQVSDSVNRRLEVKNQLGVQFGGPSFLSCNYEHFFNHHWSIEAGAGSILAISGVHVGGRYYFGSKAKPTKFAPYLGAAIGAVKGTYVGDVDELCVVLAVGLRDNTHFSRVVVRSPWNAYDHHQD